MSIRTFSTRRTVLFLIVSFFAYFSSSVSVFAAVSQESANAAWKRVASAAKIPESKINVENKKTPNAYVKFSSGTKYSVHVTTGLLEILDSEDELAGVLGHEAGHIVLGHYERAVGTNLATGLLALVLKNNSGAKSLTRLAGSVGLALAGQGVSREKEVEADDYGIRVSVVAGYSPGGLLSAMEKMRDAGFSTSPSGFNSHPPTERRLSRLAAQTEEVRRRVAEIDARNGKTPKRSAEHVGERASTETETPNIPDEPKKEAKEKFEDAGARISELYRKYGIEK